MGDSDEGGARRAAGTSIDDYAQIYPDPRGGDFTWEIVSGGLGDSEPITHFHLNAPPTSKPPEGAQRPLISTKPPPPPQQVSMSSAPAQKFILLPNPVVTAPEGAQRPPISTKPPPPPPHLFSSSSAPAEKLAVLPNPLVTPPSSDPEGAQPPPSSTQPHPPQVSSSSSAPDEKLALLPNPVVTAPERAHRPPNYAAPPAPVAHRLPSYAIPLKPMAYRPPSFAAPPIPMVDASTDAPTPSSLFRKQSRKHPFLLPRDLSPPPVSAARPRVRIPRLRKVGPKLDPELKAELAWIAEREKGFPADIVIAFVEELDKAHQYARFNNYIREEYGKIKHDSIPKDIAYELTKDNERTKKFSLVDECDIHTLVDTYVRELRQKPYYAKEAEEPVLGSLSNPVYYLEYRAREEGYVLDQKPETELKKLKKFAPMFYHNDFVLREPPAVVEARTVTVSNIAFDVPEKKIRELFRVCGPITCSETENTPKCQIAHITFQDPRSVERAQTLTSAKKALISMENAPLLVLPKFVHGASGAVSLAVETEDVGSIHANALQRYSELRTYYSQFQSKHVKAPKKEGYGRCGGMDWMGIESLVNGGYTVGGQKLRRHPKAF